MKRRRESLVGAGAPSNRLLVADTEICTGGTVPNSIANKIHIGCLNSSYRPHSGGINVSENRWPVPGKVKQGEFSLEKMNQ